MLTKELFSLACLSGYNIQKDFDNMKSLHSFYNYEDSMASDGFIHLLAQGNLFFHALANTLSPFYHVSISSIYMKERLQSLPMAFRPDAKQTLYHFSLAVQKPSIKRMENVTFLRPLLSVCRLLFTAVFCANLSYIKRKPPEHPSSGLTSPSSKNYRIFLP